MTNASSHTKVSFNFFESRFVPSPPARTYVNSCINHKLQIHFELTNLFCLENEEPMIVRHSHVHECHLGHLNIPKGLQKSQLKITTNSNIMYDK